MSKMKHKIEDICEMYHLGFTNQNIASFAQCSIDFVAHVIEEFYEAYYG